MLERGKMDRNVIEMVGIDSLVPEEHLLRKIDKAVDFSRLYEMVEPLYSEDNGRPSVDPVVLFKMVLIQHLYGLPSLRRTAEEVGLNMAYRWFLGYTLQEETPHFSTVSYNFRHRFTEETVDQVLTYRTTDSRQKFAAYCDYVIGLKEQRGVKHSTIVRYKELTGRIYPQIGHIKLRELRADHLNDLYTLLGKPGVGKGSSKATAKVDLVGLLKKKKLTRSALSQQSGVPLRTVYAAVKGEGISKEAAEAISGVLGVNGFKVEENIRTLSAKTILEHHRLISTVLEQAVKEGLVPFNVASRATLPKAEHKEVNYFQPEQVAAIRDALETEPMKWKMLVHLLLITGARRGEVLGLKWDKVDFEGNKVYICNSVLYSPDIGIYESTPKTERSRRYITLPAETMQLLRRYRAWQARERLRLGEYYQNQGFVFAQDNGKPMHPDSVTDYLKKFSKRHGLPHINAHAFRHTIASMLYFNGVDSVSISKRLGHAQVSTTANIYAHVMEEADQRNADILSDIFLKKA